MADGDVLIDSEFEVDGSSRRRIRLFACEDSSRPGDLKYRFQCYDPDTGETVLRYDNAHDHPVAGWHHRHTSEHEDPQPIEFDGLRTHIERFHQEVQSLND